MISTKVQGIDIKMGPSIVIFRVSVDSSQINSSVRHISLYLSFGKMMYFTATEI